MIKHKLEWVAEFADRVIALSEGTIIMDGEPGDVLVDEAMLEHGIGQTRYTQAARLAQTSNLWPTGRQIPVTLQQAEGAFRA